MIAEGQVERFLEELIIDITLGNFFSQAEPIRSIVGREDLTGLYKKKVAFVRSRLSKSWLDNITRSAGYVMLSSMDSLPLIDIAGRAKAAYQRWFEFSQWLKPHARRPSEETRKAARQLRQVQGLGGQLPLAKIEVVLARLPDGHYVLLVLKSASEARKSPSLRQRIRSIFGPAPKRNSFTILTRDDYDSRLEVIRPLLQSGHFAGFSVVIGASEINIMLGLS